MNTWISRLTGTYGARVCYDADNGSNGGGNGGDEAAKAAAAKAAADKAAADEAARKATGNNGGDNRPSDKEAELLREVMQRKESEKKLKGETERLAGELKKFEGIDPDQVRALLAERAKTEEEAALKRGEFDRIRANMVAEHDKALKALREQLTGKETEIGQARTLINDLTIGQAFSGSKFINDELVLTPSKARVVYGGNFDIEEGRVVAYDKERGQPNRTKLTDARGEPLPFDEAIRRLVESDADKDSILKSKLADGAGSSTSGQRPTGSSSKNNEATGRDRIAAALRAKKAK